MWSIPVNYSGQQQKGSNLIRGWQTGRMWRKNLVRFCWIVVTEGNTTKRKIEIPESIKFGIFLCRINMQQPFIHLIEQMLLKLGTPQLFFTLPSASSPSGKPDLAYLCVKPISGSPLCLSCLRSAIQPHCPLSHHSLLCSISSELGTCCSLCLDRSLSL